MRTGLYKGLSNEELVELYKAGDTEAFDELMKKTEALRSSLAQRYLNIPGSEFEDLMSEGAIEMLSAIQNFDSKNYSSSFSTFLYSAISRHYNDMFTAAVLKGEFNVDIGVGQRFSLDELNYISKKYIGRGNPTEEGGSGTYLYQMECETVGTDGNKHFGDLTAIEFITNLEIARLTEVLIPAEDEEDTEVLRARYFSSFETAPFGGNKKDYKEKANKLNGVGDTKVIPAWDGGGTVKLIIINSDFDKASDTLVSEVQEAMDPLSDRGNGSGIAPIGHTVTVVTVKEVPITVSVNIVYKEGYSWSRLGEDIKAAIEAYLLEMRKDWANQSFLSVRITQVEARLLKIEGIVDISDTKINGVADNFTLASDEIPVPSETGVVVDA